MLRTYEWSDSLMSHFGQWTTFRASSNVDNVDIYGTKPHVYKAPLLHPGGADDFSLRSFAIDRLIWFYCPSS